MILEQQIALFLEHRLDRPSEHAEHARKQHLQLHLGVLDVDLRLDRLAERSDVEVELVAGPAMLDLRAAGNMLAEAVDIVGDAPPRLVLAKFVGQVDFDGLGHRRDVGLPAMLFKRPAWAMVTGMRLLAALALLFAVPAPAQAPVATEPLVWQPTAPYVILGQDEPGYRNWMASSPRHPVYVKAFNDYLVTWGVAGVVPTWQLLRTASDWMKCGAAPFEVPPPEVWPNVVQALRYIRERVIPAVGPVEPVSVYRNPALNACAHGAAESAHRYMQAVDMVPLRPISREQLIGLLCSVHATTGEPYGIGLGFYIGLRFHIDSRKFRKWGYGDMPAAAAACMQPLPPAPVATPPATAPPPVTPPAKTERGTP